MNDKPTIHDIKEMIELLINQIEHHPETITKDIYDTLIDINISFDYHLNT